MRVRQTATARSADRKESNGNTGYGSVLPFLFQTRGR
jgi:hypothetical protein